MELRHAFTILSSSSLLTAAPDIQIMHLLSQHSFTSVNSTSNGVMVLWWHYYSHATDGEMEVWRGLGSCPRSDQPISDRNVGLKPFARYRIALISSLGRVSLISKGTPGLWPSLRGVSLPQSLPCMLSIVKRGFSFLLFLFAWEESGNVSMLAH